MSYEVMAEVTAQQAPLMFQLLVVIELGGELYIVTPIVMETGEVVLPLTGWMHLEPDDVVDINVDTAAAEGG